MKKNALTFLLAVMMPFQAQPQRMNTEGLKAFRREVKETASLLRLPGLSVAIVQDGRIIYQQHEGYADLETKKPITDHSIFWLSSVTKTFSAVMMLQYEEEGRLSLDDPVIKFPFASVGFAPQRINSSIQLKHVLSHTSEGIPGNTFVYHGGRFNFLYGSFVAMSGFGFPQAFTTELDKRILKPLSMESTLAGYPSSVSDLIKSKIVTPYKFDSEKREFVVNRDVYGNNTAFPATGVLSSVKDLAAYTTALDENRLISKRDYERMSKPFVTTGGQPLPYGIGWFSQNFNGIQMHWAYGLGDSDSSLLVRIPERKLTLIVLSNSDFANVASRLGAGNALRSPFVISFLRHAVFNQNKSVVQVDYGDDVRKIRNSIARVSSRELRQIYEEELFTQALIRSFAERQFGTGKGKAEALFKLYFETNREAFTKPDPTIIHLLSYLTGPDLDGAVDLFIKSYNRSGQFHPWTLYAIAKRFEDKGDIDIAVKYYHRLADTPGFEEQGDKIAAFSRLAKYYAGRDEFEKVGDYARKALVFTRQAGYSEETAVRQIDEINRLRGGKRSQ